MLVYGDPHYLAALGSALERLCRRAGTLDGGSLDELRLFLIEAGQFEQGAADSLAQRADSLREVSQSAMQVTEEAACGLFRAWMGEPVEPAALTRRIRAALARLAEQASREASLMELSLTIKAGSGCEIRKLPDFRGSGRRGAGGTTRAHVL